MNSTPTFITLTDRRDQRALTVNIAHIMTMEPHLRQTLCALCARVGRGSCNPDPTDLDGYDQPRCLAMRWEHDATLLTVGDRQVRVAEAYADILALINRKAAPVIDARAAGAPEVAG